jgi:hypothetical protein
LYGEPSIQTPDVPLPPPEEHARASDAGQSPEAKETIKTIQDEIYDKIGNDNSGDATDYIEETKDRQAEERGEKLSPERERDRLGRYQKAMAAASQDLDTIVTEAINQGEQLDSDLARRDRAVVRDTKHFMRVEAFEREHPDYQNTVTSVFGALPVHDHVAEALLESNISAKLAYDIAHAVAQHPDPVSAVNRLNGMSPEELKISIARIEGAHEAIQASQRNAPPARRATRAPAPLRSVSGGSAGNFDPNTASMEEYAAWFHQQQRKGRG